MTCIYSTVSILNSNINITNYSFDLEYNICNFARITISENDTIDKYERSEHVFSRSIESATDASESVEENHLVNHEIDIYLELKWNSEKSNLDYVNEDDYESGKFDRDLHRDAW